MNKKQIFIHNQWIDITRGHELNGTEGIWFKTKQGELIELIQYYFKNKTKFAIILRLNDEMNFKNVEIVKTFFESDLFSVDLRVKNE